MFYLIPNIYLEILFPTYWLTNLSKYPFWAKTLYRAGEQCPFDKTNLSIKEPHKIIISNESSCLILISYENDNNLYAKDSHEIITLSKLSDLVLKMWKTKKIKNFKSFVFSLFYKALRVVLSLIFWRPCRWPSG